MREKMQRFMSGRYGFDELSRIYLGITLVLLVISMFSKLSIFYIVSLVILVYMYVRAFSKNVTKRQEENQKYLNMRYQSTVKWNNYKKHWEQRKTHRFFHCPQCKQTVRVPRGRGKICITCPKCHTDFVKKS